MPFGEGARRPRRGIAGRQFAQAGAVDLQLANMQPPAAGARETGIGHPGEFTVAHQIAQIGDQQGGARKTRALLQSDMSPHGQPDARQRRHPVGQRQQQG